MRHLLVPTDFSETAASALNQEVKLAALSGGRITLLHVIYTDKISETLLGLDAMENLARAMNAPPESAPYSPTHAMSQLREAAQRRLDEVIAAVAAQNVVLETAVVEGRPSTEVLQYATEHGVDLIVMGTHGRSALGRAFLGSVADNVIRQAECPVMVVRR